MKDLVKLLAWKTNAEFKRRVHQPHLQKVDEAVTFWKMIMRKLDPGLADSLDSLSGTPSYRRFIDAPETHRRLVDSFADRSMETRAFVRNGILAERRWSGQLPTSRRAVWTALGDAWFPTRVTRANRPYRSPMVGGSLVLDGFSPFAKFGTSISGSRLAPYPPAEFDTLTGRLDDCVHRLATAHPAAWEMMQRVCRVIVVRKNLARAAEFVSASEGPCIGRIALTNAHFRGLPPERIVSGLIHESIHSVLFILESVAPLFPAGSLPDDVRLHSPWTDRPLHIAAYVHATCVWYALRNFWRHARISPAFSEDRVMLQIRRAERGFLGRSLTKNLGRFRNILSAYVRDSMDVMQDDVRNDHS